jgi:Signal peptidase, peptidase S26
LRCLPEVRHDGEHAPVGVAVGREVEFAADRYVSVNGFSTPIAGSPSELGPDGKPTGRHRPRQIVRVPAGHVFLLGDNTAHSIDSRAFGPVPDTELVGRVRLVVPAPTWWWAAAVFVAATLAIGTLRLATAGRRRLRQRSGMSPERQSRRAP